MPERQCDAPAAYRYTWPGHDEGFICEEHAPKLRAVAQAMGLYLQLIPVGDDERCSQKISTNA
jgi:hypothetical protein